MKSVKYPNVLHRGVIRTCLRFWTLLAHMSSHNSNGNESFAEQKITDQQNRMTFHKRCTFWYIFLSVNAVQGNTASGKDGDIGQIARFGFRKIAIAK